MTTGTLPEPPADCLRRWAAEQLDLPADISPGEARAAFMVRLRDEDFMPPLRWQQAYRVLVGKPVSESLRGRVLAEEEERLRTMVETFAVDLFSLVILNREMRWRELRDQCDFSPQLSARLRALEPGLRVIAEPAVVNPDAKDVVDHLCELFVLRPYARAIRRQQVFEQMSPATRDRLARAARHLAAAQPQFAALEPDYLGQLTSWDEENRRIRRLNRQVQRALKAPEKDDSLFHGLLSAIAMVIILSFILCGGFGLYTEMKRTQSKLKNAAPQTWPRVYIEEGNEKEPGKLKTRPTPHPSGKDNPPPDDNHDDSHAP